MILLLLISFGVIVCAVAMYEKHRYKNYATPSVLLGVPLFVVYSLTYIFAESYGMENICAEMLMLTIVYYIIFWTGGLAVSLLFPGCDFSYRQDVVERYHEYDRIVMVVIWICSIILMVGAYKIISVYGLIYIGDDEFKNKNSEGILGWARVISIFFVIHLLLRVNRRSVKILLTCAVVFLLLLFNHVKGIILLPVIAFLISRSLLQNKQIVAKQLFVFALCGTVIFFTAYLVGYIGMTNAVGVYLDADVYNNLFEHFLNYMFAGVLGFSEALKGYKIPDINNDIIITPIINMLRHVFNWKRVNNVTEYWVTISKTDGFISNVHTYIGTLVLFLGKYVGLVFLFFNSLVLYTLYYILNITRNYWLGITYSFIASALVLGWFEYYYWHALFIQGTIFGMLLSCVNYKYYNVKKLPKLNCESALSE